MDGKQFQEWASGASSIVAALAVLGAAYKYWQSRKLERVKWMVQLYEKFYEESRFKRIREILDCEEKGSSAVSDLVNAQEADFTDYLNFFEFIGYLEETKQLKSDDIEALFGFYLNCLEDEQAVRSYIEKPRNGFEYLLRLLTRRRNLASASQG